MAKPGHFMKIKETRLYTKLLRNARKEFFSKLNSMPVSENKKIIVSGYIFMQRQVFQKCDYHYKMTD